MGVELREAHAVDVEFMFDVKKQAYRTYVEQTVGNWDDDLHRSRVGALTLSNVRIIVSDGRDVGWMNVRREDAKIEIYDIYIQPEHQNKGIGSHVVQQLMDEAREKSVLFALVVLKVNPARRFYEKLGMTCVGENQTHYFMQLPTQSE